MTLRIGFVDFLFAVTVGSAFSNLGNINLDSNPMEFIVLCFLIFIVLEDYYLYHIHVVSTVRETSTSVDFFILIAEVSILLSWYLSCTFATKSHHIYALYSLAAFSFFKFAAGSIHWGIHPENIDWRFYRYFAFLILPAVIILNANTVTNNTTTNNADTSYALQKTQNHISKKERHLVHKIIKNNYNEKYIYQKLYIEALIAWITQTLIWRIITIICTTKITIKQRALYEAN